EISFATKAPKNYRTAPSLFHAKQALILRFLHSSPSHFSYLNDCCT
ncbi:unnamed protein product, partial [Tuber aestivum]